MRLSQRAAFSSGLVVAVGVLLISTVWLRPVARTVPLVVGIPTLVLLTLDLVRDIRQPSTPRSGGAGTRRSERALLLWLVSSLPVLAAFGVIVGAPLWLALFLRVRSGESWRAAGLCAGALAAVLVCILVLVLRMSPAAGAVVDWSP